MSARTLLIAAALALVATGCGSSEPDVVEIDADVGALAYGAIYLSYGPLTLASLALSMGSASIAGEERGGTMGLLLGNPKSRTHILVSKGANVILLTGLGALVLLLRLVRGGRLSWFAPYCAVVGIGAIVWCLVPRG